MNFKVIHMLFDYLRTKLIKSKGNSLIVHTCYLTLVISLITFTFLIHLYYYLKKRYKV
jgi:hypothetical protein